jgi:hypothetical protein
MVTDYLLLLTSGLLPLLDFGVTSSALFLVCDILTASAASPPVETVPATTSPIVAKQNGHMIHLRER